MNQTRFQHHIIGILCILLLLTGCAAPTATPTMTVTNPPPPTPKPPLPSPPTTSPISPPPAVSPQPIQPTAQTNLFNFIRTVQVTPDGNYLTGGFARINYVPASDRFLVTFGGQLAQPAGGCSGLGWSYKFYTTDMQSTGESGTFACGLGDSGSVMVDNNYYFVGMANNAGQAGWNLLKFDSVNWTKLVDIFFPLNEPQEGSGDPMMAFVNGQLDVSSQWTEAGGPPPPDEGGGTHHQFFTPDLQFLSKKILTDAPHICGSSMLYVDDIYYFVTATAYTGDLIVMKYDTNWQYLGSKELVRHAHWSTGMAFDGQRFYVAYLDTSQRTTPGFFPYYPNVHLAAFDREWNLVDDVAVTSFTPSDLQLTGRPWVTFHGNRLYVSYDVVPLPEDLTKVEAYVSVYELAGHPGQPVQPTQPSEQAGTCAQKDTSILGVLRSTDHAATWTSLGNACMLGSTIGAVDPTGFYYNGRVVLYLVDIKNLQNPVPQSIYRATSMDGVNFDTPQPAYTQDNVMVDPVVLPVPDGTVRLYVPSEDAGIISAVSRDGITFTREEGVRITYGGMPGALLLPDNQLRMFLNGEINGQGGIFSMISKDGLNFTLESGMRILASPGYAFSNAQPIQLVEGGYLMLYQINDIALQAHPNPWTFTEIHLATSNDGFNWTPNPEIIRYGGTSCLVEMPDGTLYIYFVNGNP